MIAKHYLGLPVERVVCLPIVYDVLKELRGTEIMSTFEEKLELIIAECVDTTPRA